MCGVFYIIKDQFPVKYSFLSLNIAIASPKYLSIYKSLHQPLYHMFKSYLEIKEIDV